MKNTIIKKTNQKKVALELAKELPDYFNEQGLKSLAKDLESQELYGAFINEIMIGFMTCRKADLAALEITWLAISPEYQNQGIGTN